MVCVFEREEKRTIDSWVIIINFFFFQAYSSFHEQSKNTFNTFKELENHDITKLVQEAYMQAMRSADRHGTSTLYKQEARINAEYFK